METFINDVDLTCERCKCRKEEKDYRWKSVHPHDALKLDVRKRKNVAVSPTGMFVYRDKVCKPCNKAIRKAVSMTYFKKKYYDEGVKEKMKEDYKLNKQFLTDNACTFCGKTDKQRFFYKGINKDGKVVKWALNADHSKIMAQPAIKVICSRCTYNINNPDKMK